MSSLVHIPWYATIFRGDKLEAALAEIAPFALRYGALDYDVHRSLDDRYSFIQMATFERKSDWERYWYGPEFEDFRARYQGYYQVPVLYYWNKSVVKGTKLLNGNGAGNGQPATSRVQGSTPKP